MDEKFSLPAAGSGQCAQNPAIMGKKYEATGRDRLLLPLTLAGCTLAADSLLLHDWGLGVTLTVLAWYALLGLRLGWGKLTAGSGKWLLLGNLLLGLWYALGSGWYFRLWNFGALAILLPLHAAGYSGEARLPWRRPAMLRERLCLILSGLFGDLGAGFAALGSFRPRGRWDLRRASGILFGCAGALALLARVLSPVLEALGIPPETAALLLVRPVSGSGALAVGSQIMEQYGPDSAVGRTAAVMLGCSETTFYTVAVYFGAAGIRRTRYTIPAALTADLAAFAAAAWAVRLCFG